TRTPHSFPTRRSSDLDCSWVDSLMYMQRNRKHVKRVALGFSGPDELRVEVGIVRIFLPRLRRVRFRGYKTHRWVVLPSRLGMVRSEEHTSELQSRFDL